jgi:D-alanyl-D-alanine carboxypeptidase/D-alanyl-D-alanine-endopeptidase (penicillin-binding protein 4)
MINILQQARPITLIKFITLVIVLTSCTSAKFIKNNIRESSNQLHYHTGFVLYDPAKKKNLVSINGDKYFTPASNTKIFTLYAGLKILGDSVPALRWINRNDSLIFWGTGDPSMLYSDVFQNSKTFNFLQNSSGKLVFSDGNFYESVLGPGWSWDDYQDYYQAERSGFPLYGNLVTVSRGMGAQPPYFNKTAVGKLRSTSLSSPLYPGILRDRFSNSFFVNPDSIPKKIKIRIPFITSGSLTAQLLADTLNREVGYFSKQVKSKSNLIYSMPVDSLYRVMMQASDNFIAEQILLMCSQKISDSLKTEIAIKKVMKDFLLDLPDAPVWVDGSGLSRYNQVSPRSIIKLWEKIYAIVPQQRLFSMLVSNGQTGTLQNMLKNQSTFIFGKTGSLSNNYCLSGYLVTKKNHLLIFSSMNANFVESTRRVRENLEKILTHIYEHY